MKPEIAEAYRRIREIKEYIKKIDERLQDKSLRRSDRKSCKEIRAGYVDMIKEERKKIRFDNFPFPEEGKLSSYFEKKTSNKELTITLTENEFLSLLRGRDIEDNDRSEYNNGWVTFGYSQFTYSVGGYSGKDYQQFGRSNLLMKLIRLYSKGDISEDLERKIIWLHPDFAEAVGVDNLSRQSQNIYLSRRPYGISNFSKSTTKQQMMGIKNGESWKNAFKIRHIHKPVLEFVARIAAAYVEAEAKRLSTHKGELYSSTRDELKQIYDFFDRNNKLDPILKQDVLGTIISILLEHEMKKFTD